MDYGGFAVRNTLLKMTEAGINGHEAILTSLFNTVDGTVTHVYAPMLISTLDVKDEFYESLPETVRSLPDKE